MKKPNILNAQSGSAFPHEDDYYGPSRGISKREYFAAHALGGLMAKYGDVYAPEGDGWLPGDNYDMLAQLALDAADLVLERMSDEAEMELGK